MILDKYLSIGEYDEAFEIAKTAEQPERRSKLLARIASNYAQDRKYDRASETFSQALTIIDKIDYRHSKESALADLADAYVEAGQHDEAIQIAKGFMGSLYKAKVLTKIADKYTEAGKYDDALALCSQALQEVRTLDTRLKSITLDDLAVTYAKAGKYDEARGIAKTIENDFFRTTTLDKIAGICFEKALEAGRYHEALGIVKMRKYSDQKVNSLADIAIKYSEEGHEVDDEAKKLLHEIIVEL